MSRPVFSFRPNMDNPEHKKAWEILMEVPKGQRNHYLVHVLWKARDVSALEDMIKKAIREELEGVVVVSEREVTVEQVPDQMLGFLAELDNL